MTEAEATYYSAPYTQVVEYVRPARSMNNRGIYARNWWRHVESRPGMHKALAGMRRFIVTPEAAKHRIFVWLPIEFIPDHQLQVIAKDDDTSFGILHSRFHIAWVRALGSPYGNHPTARRYNITRVFKTFPFPEGLTPDRAAESYACDVHAKAIASAAQALVTARNSWLNPPDLVIRTPEVVPGFPDRLLPRTAAAEITLRQRTLTGLYNQRGTPAGTWLDNLHSALDDAVAASYGWPNNINDEEVLTRLLALNQARAVAQTA